MALTYSAYAVYTYSTSPASGMAGLITDNGGALSGALTTYADMETNLNGDPKVEAFAAESGATTTSNLRVAATDRVASTPGQPVYIYDPVDVVNNKPNPTPPLVKQAWPPIENLYTVVRLGDYLYAIDYDIGRIIEINGTTPYAPTGVTYQQPVSTTSGYPARGQELIVVNGVLYGLFAYPDSNFTNYDPSVVVRFNVSPATRLPTTHLLRHQLHAPHSRRMLSRSPRTVPTSTSRRSAGGRGRAAPTRTRRYKAFRSVSATGIPQSTS